MPPTTIKTTIKTAGTVVNMSGRRTKSISSPCTVRKIVWEAKKSPRATVEELQNGPILGSLNLQLYATSSGDPSFRSGMG